MVQKIEKKSLQWRGNAPVSSQFDDVYYSEENGLAETDYVFIKGIGAPECWQDRDAFVIAETGFGTGLNFLATYKAWKESNTESRLTFISVEKFPLSSKALEAAHETFPELEHLSAELCAAWPPPSPGFHMRSFANGKVQLLLLFGDAAEAFSELEAKVDAWYLDGFAPAKNPEMWTDDLFDQIARLSQPNTKFATFTAAGFVKRGLRERGFHVEKTKGYGRKRERLVGYMTSPAVSATTNLPEWSSIPKPNDIQSVIIIGGGIAGASAAHELKQLGKNITIISDGSPAASDVPAAILSPGFQRSLQPSAVFATTCFAHACTFGAYEEAWASKRGVKLTSSDDTERARLHEIAKLLNWDTDWLQQIDSGFILPKSGTLSPITALNTLVEGITQLTGKVTELKHQENHWSVCVDNEKVTADAVIIACGMNSDLMLGIDQQLHLRPKPGQIEVLEGTDTSFPEQSHSYGGYITAEIEAERTIGSTFDALPKDGRNWPSPTNQNRLSNLQKLQEEIGVKIEAEDISKSWAGMRATTPDYLPYVGPVPSWSAAQNQFQDLAKDKNIRGLGDMPYQPNLYLMTGFGAKGFQQAPLCAAYVTALICGDPLPFPAKLIPYLHPARHMIKSIVRSNIA